MANKSNDYFGLPKILSVILALLFGGILGFIVRLTQGKTVAAIVRLIIAITGVGYVILNICDLVCIIMNGKILSLL
ncbi:MAG: hypothetical protein SOZ70_00125 [Bacilli bacterium]|nr:hypothetical protein [Bacilli bacterium]